MKFRRFQPTAVDILEERLVMTAFSVPFSIVMPPAVDVNPKFLNLTGRTESNINHAITTAFNTFSTTYTKALKVINRDPTFSASSVATFEKSVDAGLNKLASDLSKVARMVPFGGLNLNPVLQNRILGTNGVTDTTTKVNTPSLQVELESLFDSAYLAGGQTEINATEALVHSDVADYINLGVTNGDFKLTRGATLPPLS